MVIISFIFMTLTHDSRMISVRKNKMLVILRGQRVNDTTFYMYNLYVESETKSCHFRHQKLRY